MKAFKYLFTLLAFVLLVPQQSLAATSASYNPITKELSFISDDILDCDSSGDIYYLQTFIMNNAGPYYNDPDVGAPVPENAWYAYYIGGSYIAPYTEVFDASQLLPGTYYAFVTCIDTQVNVSEYVPAHTPYEFTVTLD